MPSGSIPLRDLTAEQQAALAREAILALPHDVGQTLVQLDPGREAAHRQFIASILPPEGRDAARPELEAERERAMVEARRLIDGASASLSAAAALIRGFGMGQDDDIADELDYQASQPLARYLAELDQQLAGADLETGDQP